jgi:hypothetical protein
VRVHCVPCVPCLPVVLCGRRAQCAIAQGISRQNRNYSTRHADNQAWPARPRTHAHALFSTLKIGIRDVPPRAGNCAERTPVPVCCRCCSSKRAGLTRSHGQAKWNVTSSVRGM